MLLQDDEILVSATFKISLGMIRVLLCTVDVTFYIHHSDLAHLIGFMHPVNTILSKPKLDQLFKILK